MLYIDIRTYIRYNHYVDTIERMFCKEMKHMDYMKLIVELLDKADNRALKLIYCYVKAILGLG